MYSGFFVIESFSVKYIVRWVFCYIEKYYVLNIDDFYEFFLYIDEYIVVAFFGGLGVNWV